MKKQKKLKIKSLCKLNKKEVEANLNEIILLVNLPKFICSKCTRVANEEWLLCHSHKL